MAQKKASVGLILIAFLIIVFGGLYFMAQDKDGLDESAPESAEQAVDEDTEILAGEPVNIDAAAAISERILGNPSAPIKISEHSSLTCSHCGAFHKKTFKEVKAKLIDTGKAYIVFSDFPLNAPALHASMVARCLPQDQYFDFVQMLFETQDDWAYERNYIEKLEEKAAAHGMSAEEVKACVDNKAIQEGILNRMRAAQAQWQIASTPSFVINNKTVIAGGRSFEDFEKAINEAVAPAPESPAEEEAAPAE